MNHHFGESEPFTVGMEEELLLVDAGTLQLAHASAGFQAHGIAVGQATTRRSWRDRGPL